MPLNDEDTITADGTEQTVWDVTTGTKFLMGQIDLQEMQTGDTLVIRRYIKVRTSSTLAVEWEDTYADACTASFVPTALAAGERQSGPYPRS